MRTADLERGLRVVVHLPYEGGVGVATVLDAPVHTSALDEVAYSGHGDPTVLVQFSAGFSSSHYAGKVGRVRPVDVVRVAREGEGEGEPRSNGRKLAERQRIPPARALVKYRARLGRVTDFDLERLGSASRSKVQSLEERKPFATDLAFVLRDYERLLADLLPPEDTLPPVDCPRDTPGCEGLHTLAVACNGPDAPPHPDMGR